jgi:hypothetical protein
MLVISYLILHDSNIKSPARMGVESLYNMRDSFDTDQQYTRVSVVCE